MNKDSFDKTTMVMIVLALIFIALFIHPKSVDWLSRQASRISQESLRNIALVILLSYHMLSVRKQVSFWRKKYLFNLQNGFVALIGGNALLLSLAMKAGLHMKQLIPVYFVLCGYCIVMYYLVKFIHPTVQKLKERGFKMISKQAEEYCNASSSSVLFVFVYWLLSTMACCYALFCHSKVIWF